MLYNNFFWFYNFYQFMPDWVSSIGWYLLIYCLILHKIYNSFLPMWQISFGSCIGVIFFSLFIFPIFIHTLGLLEFWSKSYIKAYCATSFTAFFLRYFVLYLKLQILLVCRMPSGSVYGTFPLPMLPRLVLVHF